MGLRTPAFVGSLEDSILKWRRVNSRTNSRPRYSRNVVKSSPSRGTIQCSIEHEGASAAIGPEVAFVLIQEPSKAFVWIAEGPELGKKLFAEARRWYQFLDKDAKVEFLSLGFPNSRRERHIVEDDSDNMVKFFLDEVKNSRTADESTITIKVTLVR